MRVYYTLPSQLGSKLVFVVDSDANPVDSVRLASSKPSQQVSEKIKNDQNSGRLVRV